MKQYRLFHISSLSRLKSAEILESVFCLFLAAGFLILAKKGISSSYPALYILTAAALVNAFGLIALGIDKPLLRFPLLFLIGGGLAFVSIVIG
jgi:hypothetical protein